MIGAVLRRARAAGEEGFTLVELVVASGMAAFVVASLANALGAVHVGNRFARQTAQASAAARAAIESAQGLGWAHLGHPVGSLVGDPLVVNDRYDPDAGGPLGSEGIVYDAAGQVAPAVVTRTYNNAAFQVHTYVTSSVDATRRISVLVTWSEAGKAHATSLGTILNPQASVTAAAASVLSGTIGGTPLADVARVQADSPSGSDSASVQSFSPGPAVSGATASASARVTLTPAAHAGASVQSVSVGLAGLTVQVNGAAVQADASVGSISASGTGTVSINGVPTVNPAPGTVVAVPGWRIVMNDRRLEPDGSMSVTFVRMESTLTSDELTLCWAWVRPVGSP